MPCSIWQDFIPRKKKYLSIPLAISSSNQRCPPARAWRIPLSEFLVPVDTLRAQEMLRDLGFYTSYSKKGAERVKELLRTRYQRLFKRMEERSFANGAFVLEMTGASTTDPMLFVSHLDSLSCKTSAKGSPTAPLQRAHLIALFGSAGRADLRGVPPGRGFDHRAVDGRAVGRGGGRNPSPNT